MSLSSQAFCLFLNPEVDTDLPTCSTPLGLRYLELSDCERFSDRGGKLSRPQNGDPSIRLEAIRTKMHNSVLMTFEPGLQVSLNGLPAACFSVLNPGDVLRFVEHGLHLSLINRPYTGPPDESHLAAKCGYCRLPIQDEPGMRIYDCPHCHLPTHSQGEEMPAEKRLECAKLSSHCGHCQGDIVESEGFVSCSELLNLAHSSAKFC